MKCMAGRHKKGMCTPAGVSGSACGWGYCPNIDPYLGPTMPCNGTVLYHIPSPTPLPTLLRSLYISLGLGTVDQVFIGTTCPTLSVIIISLKVTTQRLM